MSRIFIARHGNTFGPGDVVTRVGARTDLPLSESGKEQGVKLGKHFLGSGVTFDAVFCSTLKRTQQTADLVLKELSISLIPEVLSFLTEIDYGPDENLPEEVVRERIGEQALEDWEQKGIPPEGWLVDPEQLAQDWTEFFSQVHRDFQGKTVLVVTSNGIARFALKAIGDGNTHTLKLKTGAYGEVRINGDEIPEVVSWNIRP